MTETKRLENWLLEKGDIGERLITEAHVQLNTDLKDKGKWQSLTYKMVHLYGRQELIAEIKKVEEKLFSEAEHKNFRERIRSIFRK